MIEAGRHFLEQLSERFRPKTEIERSLGHMPKRPVFRYEPKELEKWETWVFQFLPVYAAANGEERTKVLPRLTPPIIEMIEKFGTDNDDYKETVQEILTSLAPQAEPKLDSPIEATGIPVSLLHHRPGEKQEKRLLRDIIYEKIVQNGVHDDLELEIAILRRLLKGKIKKPEDPEYTKKVLEKYPEDARVKKLMKKIHKRFHEWSKNQMEP